jgi:hypothetical protein
MPTSLSVPKPLRHSAALSLIALACSMPAAAGVLYGTDNFNLYTIDKATGAGTLVGSMVGNTSGQNVIDMTSGGGTLYGLVMEQVGNVTQSRIATIDASTGALSFGASISGIVTTSGPARRIDTIAYDATTGTMYGVNNGPNKSLYTIDLATGAATQVGGLSFGSNTELYRSLGIGANGTLYAALLNTNTGSSTLGTIHTGSAAQSLLGQSVQAQIADLAYDFDDGVLYGGGGLMGGTEAQLYGMDTTTGAGNLIGGTTAATLWAGLAVLPAAAQVPEPSSLLLGATAVLGLLAAGRRRRS